MNGKENLNLKDLKDADSIKNGSNKNSEPGERVYVEYNSLNYDIPNKDIRETEELLNALNEDNIKKNHHEEIGTKLNPDTQILTKPYEDELKLHKPAGNNRKNKNQPL